MKKIASVLLITIFSLVLFTACEEGKSAALTDKVIETPADSAENEVTVLTVSEEDVSLSAQNASFVLSSDGVTLASLGVMEFGSYPQTVAEKKAVKGMSLTTDATGYYYYINEDGETEHYAKITMANVYGDKYTFINEKNITERNTYYFKVEPIRWIVFGQVNAGTGSIGGYLLVSEQILDNSSFLAEANYFENPGDGVYYNRSADVRANDWMYSSLRKWLNGDFYRSAFSKKEKEQLTQRVAGTSTGESGEQVTEYDNVFAMTKEQAESLSNTFAVVSDYARCKDTWMSIYPDFYGYGRWWTMTEGNTSYRICYGGTDNKVPLSAEGESVGATYMGVRPVICINIEDLASIIVADD